MKHESDKAREIMGYQRDEIEKCIKKFNVDRNRFYEVSKHSHKQIIKQIEDAFVDKSNRWSKDIHWSNMGYYRPDLKCFMKTMDNWNWVNRLSEIIPSLCTSVYVLFEDAETYESKYWLYEAYISELITILNESALWGDFYIVSKKYEWLISLNHHDVISCIGGSLRLDSL